MDSKYIYWSIVALALIVYATMLMWTLPAITQQAGGLLVFDLRPTGYSFQDAKALLTALTSEGKAIYGGIQHQLDTAFPALSAISTGWGIYLLSAKGFGKIRVVLPLIAIPGMVFDYLENASVAKMLNVGAEGLTEPMVATASFYSQMKAVFVTVALTILLLLIIRWIVSKWRRAA